MIDLTIIYPMIDYITVGLLFVVISLVVNNAFRIGKINGKVEQHLEHSKTMTDLIFTEIKELRNKRPGG